MTALRVTSAVAAGLLAGAVLGWAAWGEGRVPVLALALPFFVAFASTRLQAFAVGAGYALGMLRHNAAFVASWFDGNLGIGASVVLTYALCTGLVWCMGWSASAAGHRKALAFTAAWLLALVPPFCLAVPGHPLVTVGHLLPGVGWPGVVLAVTLPAAAIWVITRYRGAGYRPQGVSAALACGLAALGIALHTPPPTSSVRGVQPVRTEWGFLRSTEQTLLRMELIGRTALSPNAVAVVWPESILGRYEPSMFRVLDLEVLGPARAAGRVHVIGMDIPMRGERLLNSAVAFYPDGRSSTAVARQPAPLSLWRPWKDGQTFVASWSAQNMLDLGQGDRAAVIFCYEEYLPVLYLLNEARDRPTMYLALANTWASRHPTPGIIQTWHSLGMARLFGRDYVKAENRPTAAAADWSPSVAP